jgi:hypothetical protein
MSVMQHDKRHSKARQNCNHAHWQARLRNRRMTEDRWQNTHCIPLEMCVSAYCCCAVCLALTLLFYRYL